MFRVSVCVAGGLERLMAHGRFLLELSDYRRRSKLSSAAGVKRQDDVLVIAEHLLEKVLRRSISLSRDFHRLAGICVDTVLVSGNVRRVGADGRPCRRLGRNAGHFNRGISAASRPVPILGRTPAQLRVLYRGFDGRPTRERAATSHTLAVARESFERDYILSVLKQVDGSRTTRLRSRGSPEKRSGISANARILLQGEAEEEKEGQPLFRLRPAFPQLDGAIPRGAGQAQTVSERAIPHGSGMGLVGPEIATCSDIPESDGAVVARTDEHLAVGETARARTQPLCLRTTRSSFIVGMSKKRIGLSRLPVIRILPSV